MSGMHGWCFLPTRLRLTISWFLLLFSLLESPSSLCVVKWWPAPLLLSHNREGSGSTGSVRDHATETECGVSNSRPAPADIRAHEHRRRTAQEDYDEDAWGEGRPPHRFDARRRRTFPDVDTMNSEVNSLPEATWGLCRSQSRLDAVEIFSLLMMGTGLGSLIKICTRFRSRQVWPRSRCALGMVVLAVRVA